MSVTNTGTGNNVLATSPTLVTPALGTPSALVLTNATGLTAAAFSAASASSNSLINVGLSTSVAASALTIALKQNDGTTDPASGTGSVVIAFRDTTIANGDYTLVSATAATSVVVPSVATLGTTNGTTGFIYVYAINNAGTVVLGVSSSLFDDGSLQSTTTISSGATSLSTIYSTSGVSSKAIKLIGRLTNSQTTAGTWAAVPTQISLPPFSNIQNREIFTIGSNGYGSTNTLVGRIGAGSTTYVGDGLNVFTLADSSTLGSTLTVNKTGLYSGTLSWSGPSGSAEGVGLSRNLATNTSVLTANSNFLFRYFTGAASMLAGGTFLKYLTAGDVLRINVNGGSAQQFPTICELRVQFLGELAKIT